MIGAERGAVRRSAVCLVLLAAGSGASAEEPPRFELTPYGGYRFGGTFEDDDAGLEIELGDDASYGLIVNLRDGPDTQYEIIYSRQGTSADTAAVAELPPVVEIDIEHLQIGGTYQGRGERARPYLALTLGGSRLSPDFTGGVSDTFWSFSIGTGLTFRPSARIGLRVEARAWATLIDSDSSLFCESGPEIALCAIALDGDVLWQLETFAGIVFRF